MHKTRLKLVQATERLLRTSGLARITTREIAREAQVAEGALYHHFKDKAALIDAVVQCCVGEFHETLRDLLLLAGKRSVQENLENTLLAAFVFQFDIVPIICSLFADHELLDGMRQILHERRVGPGPTLELLAAYLHAEQELGRVAQNIQPQSAAELLLGGCLQAALLDHLLARETSSDMVRLRVHEAVRTVLTGLEPRRTDQGLVPAHRNGEP